MVIASLADLRGPTEGTVELPIWLFWSSPGHRFDLGGGKVCALASRVEPRDYVDTAAAMGRYRMEQMIGFARRLDPGLTDRDFADAVQRLDQWGDGVFAPFGLSPKDVAVLRERFAAWPRT